MSASRSDSDNPSSGKAPKARGRSKKLGRTLQELETAFHDWEALSSNKARQAAIEEDRRKSKGTAQSEEEFRKKTKKLLSQLRQQLAELND